MTASANPPARRTCSVCGFPIRHDNSVGICQRNAVCEVHYRAARGAPKPKPRRQCSTCGKPIPSHTLTDRCGQCSGSRKATPRGRDNPDLASGRIRVTPIDDGRVSVEVFVGTAFEPVAVWPDAATAQAARDLIHAAMRDAILCDRDLRRELRGLTKPDGSEESGNVTP